jgi:hypothetical protein
VTHGISSEDSERLLSGGPGPDETAGLADVTFVLRALRAPATPTEVDGLASALRAVSRPITVPMIKRRLTGKALAVIGAVTLVSAGTAAAAGVVPTPFSSSKPSASVTKDVDADESTEETDDDVSATEATTTTDEIETTEAIDTTEVIATTESLESPALADVVVDTDAQGPDVNGPAKFGLCTAYAARTKHDVTTTAELGATPAAEPDSDSADLPVPFQALTDAALAAGQSVADFCADAVPGGSADDSTEDGDNPSATAPGKSNDNPSATAPGRSDDNPSGAAPGKSGAAPGHIDGSHGPASRHS